MVTRKETVLSIVMSLVFLSAASAATITGTVKYEGDVPTFKPIKMDADPICLTKHSSPVMPESLVLGDDNAMANVFVHISKGVPKKDYPAPAEPVVITQAGCEYTPHVAGVMVGQTLKILNPDGTLHNVHVMSKINPEFNLAMPKFRTETTKVFEKEEFMIPFKCDVHPWMGAWVAVMGNPYFSVTQKDGKFTIPDLPAGTYEIQAWHEKLGTKTQTVTVGDTDTATADFTFSKPQK